MLPDKRTCEVRSSPERHRLTTEGDRTFLDLAHHTVGVHASHYDIGDDAGDQEAHEPCLEDHRYNSNEHDSIGPA